MAALFAPSTDYGDSTFYLSLYLADLGADALGTDFDQLESRRLSRSVVAVPASFWRQEGGHT
jgi:hypothetical protein